jgi:subtilisin
LPRLEIKGRSMSSSSGRPKPKPPATSWLWVMLACLVIVLIVVLFVLVFAYKRRRGAASSSSSSSSTAVPVTGASGSTSSSSSTSTGDTGLSIVDEAEEGGEADVESIPRSPATPLAALHRHPGLVAEGSYIIVFRDAVANVMSATQSVHDSLAALNVVHRFEGCVRGFSACHLKAPQIERLRAHPSVQSVHEDGIMTLGPVSMCASLPSTQQMSWSVKRAGAPESSLNVGTAARTGRAESKAIDVDVFVLDTGVDIQHPDLNIANSGKSFVPGSATVNDVVGHGTFVAGMVGARDNQYGVVGTCPNVRIFPVKVLDDEGSGQFSWLIAGVNYVRLYKQQNPSRPVVVNMSLGGYVGTSGYNVLDNAVAALINTGVTVVIAAGNSAANAAYFSPAHVRTAITVGAMNTSNRLSSYSNWGSVVSIFAGGDGVRSTFTGKTYSVMSGTSFSAPQVAGAAALYLSKYRTASPAQVKAALIAASAVSTANPAVKSVPSGTTNRALYMASL